MLPVLVSLGIGFTSLFVVEELHRRKIIRTELARKIIHLTSGLVLATWPFFVTWKTIVLLEVGFIIAVGVARWTKFFGSQHGINRITWGEFFFPLGAILCIWLGTSRWVFVLAILHLALADAAAALIGTKYGKGNSYRVFGQKKSIIGSSAFFATSVLLVISVFLVAPENASSLSIGAFILLPFVTTLAENLGAYGTDNLLIPLSVVIFLS